MLQLATPPERPRPAFLASIGIHAVAASAFGLGPLLVLPEAPGWTGAVWVVTQPDLSVLRESTPVDLRDLPAPRPATATPGGGLPPAPREGARPGAPVFQPGSVPEAVPEPSTEEPAGDPGVAGGVDDGTGVGTEPGLPGGVPGGTGPIDLRGGEPPDLVLPVALDTPPPRYPDTARLARAAGVVVLSATIAADGRVVDVAVESSASPLLEHAAVEAVARWRYRPAAVGSRPVAVILRVTLTFRLA
jgi:protein TonB